MTPKLLVEGLGFRGLGFPVCCESADMQSVYAHPKHGAQELKARNQDTADPEPQTPTTLRRVGELLF